MKFMKLGSKPDAFRADGPSIRYVQSDLATDIVVNVGEVKFFLHKFPLLSKSHRLLKLVRKANQENLDEIELPHFPGGPKAFEICAKFCYGISVTLNAYNVVAARSAAHYLEMTEDFVDKGNLIFKIEVFLNSGIFQSWKDSILVLQTSQSLLPWSEDLKIVTRCIDSIASKTSVDPETITWSYTYGRKIAENIPNSARKLQDRTSPVPRDWWVEDICELEIELYKRVLLAIKSRGRMEGNVIGEALKTYAMRWLPDSVEVLVSEDHMNRNKFLLETIICLLPSDQRLGCTCSFLLKLLKVAVLVEADDSAREDLVNRISLRLDEASANDLLIPSTSPQTTIYDVELVQRIVHRFMMREPGGWDASLIGQVQETDEFMLEHGSLMNVGKLIDWYLVKIAHDPNLSILSFVNVFRLVPESARPVHDGLYMAIDIYLKEHPNLTKQERKKVCGLMDVKRLTMEASTHAAQNDRLPLRVIVQVLFFEQIRAAARSQSASNALFRDPRATINVEEECDESPEDCQSLEQQMSLMKLNGGKVSEPEKLAKKNSKSRGGNGLQMLHSRSRRIFDKLWGLGESKSSETSGSSLSPGSVTPGETKSSVSSSKHRRYSTS